MNIFKKLLFFVSVYNLYFINILAEKDINEEIKLKLKKESYGGFSESFDYFLSKNGRIDNANNILTLGGEEGSRVFLKSKIRPLSLLSSTATIDLNKNIITASGEEKTDKKTGKRIRTRVEVRINNDRVLFADKFIYNFSSQNGFVHDALFLYKDYVIRCQKARMDYDGTFYGENVFFTTCKYVYPSWGFTIRNAVYNKSFILGKGVSLMFLGRELTIPLPFIYFFPAKEKTGFVYPTGIWFDSSQGLYFDPGFYFYFGECADILLRVKWYSSGSSVWEVRHRYIRQGYYNGSVVFEYVFARNEHFSTDASSGRRSPFESYFFQWDNSSVFKFYKNNLKLSLYYDDMQSQNQKAEFFVSHSFVNIPFISALPLSHGYNKNFKTKFEYWDFAETSFKHSFEFLRFFAFSPSLSFKSRSSNEDVDFYVRDDNDFDFDDDVENEDGEEELVVYGPENRKPKVNISKFYSASWKDYFTKDYWKKVWEQTNSGVSISVPFYINVDELKWFKISLSSLYNVKLYSSFLEKNSDGEYVRASLFFTQRKIAFIHDFNSLLRARIVSPDFSFSYNQGTVVSSFSIPVSFSYSPSSEIMHDLNKFPAFIMSKIPFFIVKQPYVDAGADQVSIFSHSVFGNVNNCREGKLKFSFNFNSYSREDQHRNDILSFSVSGGYDFLADNKKTFKWQNIDINIAAPFLFGFKYSTSINLYKYEPIGLREDEQVSQNIKANNNIENVNNIIVNEENNNKGNNNVADANEGLLKKGDGRKFRKTANLFWDNSTTSPFFRKKNFLFHRFGFSFPLSHWFSGSLRDSDGYSSCHVLNNFHLSVSYDFTYVHNPVQDKTVVLHFCNLRFNAKITNHWEFFSNLSLREKNGGPWQYSNSYLGIRRVLCDCWMLYICISYDKDTIFKKNDFRCVISIRPLDPNIDIFAQRRIFNVGV